jgi:hypothetical protein
MEAVDGPARGKDRPAFTDSEAQAAGRPPSVVEPAMLGRHSLDFVDRGTLEGSTS